MSTRPEYRARARAALGGNIFAQGWLLILLVIVCVSAITSLVSFTLVGSLILMGPLAFLTTVFIMNTVRNTERKNDLNLITEALKTDFVGNLLLGLFQALFIFLWSLLFFIPGIIKSIAYSMSYFIKFDHPEYDWKQCLDESQKMMKGHKWQLFVLELSFIGWYIVGALCFGVGIFWVNAYEQTTLACYYEDLKNVQTAEG